MTKENPDEVSQEEANQLEAHLRKMAEMWHKRLEDPTVKAQIEAGTLALSPLVRQLLDAYPRTKEK